MLQPIVGDTRPTAINFACIELRPIAILDKSTAIIAILTIAVCDINYENEVFAIIVEAIFNIFVAGPSSAPGAFAVTERERFVACCMGEAVDRPPYWLCWVPWRSTWKRWQGEGMTFKTFDEVRDYFGAEKKPQVVPVNYGPCPNRGIHILQEDDRQCLYIDSWGIKRRDFKEHESMSAFLESPVKNREDWESYKVAWLDPNHPDRLKGEWLPRSKMWMDKGYPIQLGNYPDVTLFGGVQWLLGAEECLMAFYDMPDLVHDIMEHLTNLYLHIFQQVVDAGVRVDVIHIWEDMSGRQGSLISPAHFRQFMTPRYARIREFADRHNISLMSMDTDGNPNSIVPPMMEGGVNYLWPMEVTAGADVNIFRKKYPKLALMGGFDKRAAAQGPHAIEAEIERIRPAVENGRYIPNFDHLIPDDVSWSNFCYYAQSLKRLVGKK